MSMSNLDKFIGTVCWYMGIFLIAGIILQLMDR